MQVYWQPMDVACDMHWDACFIITVTYYLELIDILLPTWQYFSYNSMAYSKLIYPGSISCLLVVINL